MLSPAPCDLCVPASLLAPPLCIPFYLILLCLSGFPIRPTPTGTPDCNTPQGPSTPTPRHPCHTHWDTFEAPERPMPGSLWAQGLAAILRVWWQSGGVFCFGTGGGSAPITLHGWHLQCTAAIKRSCVADPRCTSPACLLQMAAAVAELPVGRCSGPSTGVSCALLGPGELCQEPGSWSPGDRGT